MFFYEFCEILRAPFVATGIPPDGCFCITRVKERNQSSEMKISKILMIPIIDSALKDSETIFKKGVPKSIVDMIKHATFSFIGRILPELFGNIGS